MAVEEVHVAYDPFGGHEALDALEQKFIHYTGSYADMPAVAVCDRWATVRGVLKDRLRGRHLYEDFTPLFEEAERSFTGTPLFATYDLAALQGHFYWVMKRNGCCRAPCYQWHTTYADYWQRRLADRHRDTLPWRWGPAAPMVLSPHTPAPRAYEWRRQ